MDKSCGIPQMSSRRFYSLPLKSMRNNKLLIREFQNITTMKEHRVIQELKAGNGSSSPRNQVLPQKVQTVTPKKILCQILDTKLQFATVKEWERQSITRVPGFSNYYFLLHFKGFPSRLCTN